MSEEPNKLGLNEIGSSIDSSFFDDAKLQRLFEKIKDKTINADDEKAIYRLSKEELLTKDNNGTTFLECLINNNINNSASLDYYTDVEIAYIYYKCGEGLYSFSLEEEDLFKEFDGEFFIASLIKNNKFPSYSLGNIKNRIEIIDILIESNNDYLFGYLDKELISKLFKQDRLGNYPVEKYLDNISLMRIFIDNVDDAKMLLNAFQKSDKRDILLALVNEKALLDKVDTNEILLDYLLRNNITPDVLENGSDSPEFAKFLWERKMYDSLVKQRKDALLAKLDGEKYLIEELLDLGYTSFQNVFSFDEDIIKLLYKKGYIDLIVQKIHADDLLIEVEPGIQLIDVLLEKKVNDIPSGISSVEVAQKLLDHDRIDLLIRCKYSVLLENATLSKTFFEYLLDSVKDRKINCDLNKISFGYKNELNEKVNFYLKLAEKDMMRYVRELNEKDLLERYDGKMLLEALLDADQKLTTEKILSNGVKGNIKIAVILRSRGLKQNLKIPVKKEEYTKDYLDERKNTLGMGPLPQEGEEKLKELEELFMNDGKSDKGLISALVSGYREALFVNYALNIQELQNLINVKREKYERFVYLRIDDGAYFAPYDGYVCCDGNVVDTLMHETGHALHHYLAKGKTPDEYNIIISKIAKDPEMLKRVDYFSKNYQKIRQKVKLEVEEKAKEYFESYYTEEKEKEIKEFLETYKDEKIKDLKKLKVPDETIDTIIKTSFTIEEYKECQKRIFKEEYIDNIFRTRYGNIMAISDILDAIYGGYLHSGKLKNKNNEMIKSVSGHGIAYYSSNMHGFDEMVANYSAIVKSKNSHKSLNVLNLLVGDEIFNMLSNFYQENISKVKEKDHVMGGR